LRLAGAQLGARSNSTHSTTNDGQHWRSRSLPPTGPKGHSQHGLASWPTKQGKANSNQQEEDRSLQVLALKSQETCFCFSRDIATCSETNKSRAGARVSQTSFFNSIFVLTCDTARFAFAHHLQNRACCKNQCFRFRPRIGSNPVFQIPFGVGKGNHA
jgi:hypothetical protein